MASVVYWAVRTHPEGGNAAYLLFSVVSGSFALWCVWKLPSSHRTKRWLEDLPESRIASAAQGVTRLLGTADALPPGTTLTAPLTKTPCLWYSYTIHERRGKSVVLIDAGTSSTPFGLRDWTGVCRILPAGARVESRRTTDWRGDTERPGEPESSGFFSKSFGAYLYSESLILPGDTIHVLGWFQSLPTNAATLSENDRLRELKANRPELIRRFDQNKDGEIDGNEWDAARAAVRAEVQAAPPAASPTDTVHAPGESDLPFYISNAPADRGRTRAIEEIGAFALGFLICGALSAWFLSCYLDPRLHP